MEVGIISLLATNGVLTHGSVCLNRNYGTACVAMGFRISFAGSDTPISSYLREDGQTSTQIRFKRK